MLAQMAHPDLGGSLVEGLLSNYISELMVLVTVFGVGLVSSHVKKRQENRRALSLLATSAVQSTGYSLRRKLLFAMEFIFLTISVVYWGGRAEGYLFNNQSSASPVTTITVPVVILNSSPTASPTPSPTASPTVTPTPSPTATATPAIATVPPREPLTPDEVQRWCTTPQTCPESRFQQVVEGGRVDLYSVSFADGLPATFEVPDGITVIGWDCLWSIQTTEHAHLENVCSARFYRK